MEDNSSEIRKIRIPIRPGRVRIPDYITSIAGAKSVHFRADSQKHRLLKEYALWAITDEEAATEAGLLKSNYWKRCGELRQDGLIEPTGRTAPGEAGVERMICRITEKGLDALRDLGE